MTKDELVILVQKIIDAKCSEEEELEILDILERNVPYPGIQDLIFSLENLTAEEVIEEALKYKPIQL